MSSFYAELAVAGSTYPLRQCQFGFAQATDARGRVVAKVRHGQLHLTLDVPDNNLLLAWASTAHKRLAGHITFFEADRRTARETVSFEAGQCVRYQESFEAGNAEAGAYVCQLVIAAEKLVLTPGGAPGAFVPAAAREYTNKHLSNMVPALATVKRWNGGAGPDGMGDTIGKFSGRQFDPDNCGGPIINASWQEVAINAEGIAKVQTHVSRYGEDPDNDAIAAS